MTTVDNIKFGTSLAELKKEDAKYFHLNDDGKYEDVIFLYPSVEAVRAFTVHSSTEHNMHRRNLLCKGIDCPYCKAGSKAYNKFFIPLFNLRTNTIQFWERAARRYEVIDPRYDYVRMLSDLFDTFTDLTKYVFRITRIGELGNVSTYYKVSAFARNRNMPYQKILDDYGISFPEYYKTIIEDVDFTPEPEKLEPDPTYTALICKGCGAPLDAKNKRCNFCGTSYIWHEPSPSVMPKVGIGW